MKILNVDDNRENIYFLESLLRAHGHAVVNAFNGVEALAELERTGAAGAAPFDLVVTDVLMPEMDGFQLCREIQARERLRRIPVIVYTATYTSRQDKEFALSLGAARFIVKPAEPDEFMAEVAAVLLQPPPQASSTPPAPEDEYLRTYNQRLIEKLERKVSQLEAAHKELTGLVAERDREIALRCEVEADLRRSEEQLRLVWEHSADGMLLIGAAGKILKANAALAAICGTSTAELQAADAAQRLGWKSLLADGRLPERFECSLNCAGGTPRTLECAATSLDFSGRPVVFVLVRDVTENRRREAERAALEGQLAESRKMETIGRLAGGIAHDFNNLLTVINGFCEIALRRTPPEAPGRKELIQVLAAGERAADLAGHLLAFSRRRQTSVGTINLNHVVEESVAMLRRLVGDHIVIVTRLDPALGSITGDSGQILQVLMNLAANSRDAMPGGGTLTIATANVEAGAIRQSAGPGAWQSPPPQGPLVSLVVTDTGAGMSPEVKQHAFDPFFTTKAGAGTGLGLFTVAGIVQRHGGAISVRSTSQQAREPAAAGGTAFEILLPRLTVPAAAGGPAPSAAARRRGPQASGGETILVVDDRAEVRELVGVELRECGYTVLEAASGPEALRMASDHAGAIDLLLTDLLMPGMSGPDLAARLRASCSGLAVLYMSGNPDAHASLVEGDGVHWIQKPFHWDDLARKVRQVLDA